MIGIYAHHHGSGHIQRCREIRRALGRPHKAVILSTHPDADVVLPDDAGATDTELTAGGTLHFAPTTHAGYGARMQAVAQWVGEHDPAVFYVDVSVEVAVLVRLLGVPVVTIAMPGVREDAPHSLGYDQASAIIAAWPEWVDVPPHLHDHAAKVHAVGGITRLTPGPAAPRQPRTVTVMAGTGGSTWNRGTWEAVEQACPDWDFTILDEHTRIEDDTELTTLLQRSAVVVAAAGQNSVADIAACEAPAIILPQPRPFGEQEATADVLRERGLALVSDTFPAPERWPALLTEAAATETRWGEWQTAGAAQRAAAVLEGFV